MTDLLTRAAEALEDISDTLWNISSNIKSDDVSGDLWYIAGMAEGAGVKANAVLDKLREEIARREAEAKLLTEGYTSERGLDPNIGFDASETGSNDKDPPPS